MRRVLIALVLVLAATTPVSGRADPGSAEAARTEAQYRDAVIRARRLRSDAEDLARRIRRAEAQLAALPDTGDAATAAQRAALAAAGRREAEALQELARAGAPLTRLLGALQTLTRHPPPPLLVSTRTATDTVRATLVLRALVPPLEARTATARARRDAMVTERRRLALGSERLFVSESEDGDQRAELQTRLEADRGRHAVLSAEAAQAERQAQALARRLTALHVAVPHVPEAATPPLRLPGGRATLVAPVAGPPDVQFGQGSTGWHWQADGRAVVAPLSAMVLHAGPLEGWGLVVILDAGPGWRVVVAGLATLEVDSEQRVAAGARLGMGGPDQAVILELRREEIPIDPSPWMD